MEKQISDLLKTSAMTHPRQQQASEEAAMAKMRFSAEEQAARQAAVRKQRELMFRAERKNKRLNKIKSKAYRRLARKEASNKLTMEEMEQLDEIDEGSRAQEARERMEVERAKERAGLRHSSKRNRFAREVQGMHGLEVDDELRRGEVERVQREQKLREKIMGQPQDSDADDDDEDASIDENDDEAIRAAAVKELDRGDARDAQEQSKREAPKGLMGMKFMQAAMARREVEQKDLEDQFRKDIQGENSGRESDSAEENNDAAVDGNAGRRVFIPPRREEQTEVSWRFSIIAERSMVSVHEAGVSRRPFRKASSKAKKSKQADFRADSSRRSHTQHISFCRSPSCQSMARRRIFNRLYQQSFV